METQGDGKGQNVPDLIARCTKLFEEAEPISSDLRKEVLNLRPKMTEEKAKGIATKYASEKKANREVIQAVCVLGEEFFFHHVHAVERVQRAPMRERFSSIGVSTRTASWA